MNILKLSIYESGMSGQESSEELQSSSYSLPKNKVQKNKEYGKII